MKITKTHLYDLSKEITLRNDYQYIDYYNKKETDEYYGFYDLFEIIDARRNIELTDEDFKYAEIGMTNSDNEVFPITLNFNNRNEDLNNESLYKKIDKGNIIKPQINDILISKVRPNLKKIIFIDEEKSNIYFTSAFICIRPKKMSKILYYGLRTIFFNDILSLSRIGKGYPTINEKDLEYLKFSKNIVDNWKINEEIIQNQILLKESEITSLRKNIIDEKEIINSIFEETYNFKEKLNENNSINYKVRFSKLSEDMDMRFSAKFHRPLKTNIENIFSEMNCKRLKDFVEIPLMTGKSISPMDYSEVDLGISYISMKSIGSWNVEKTNMNYVTIDYEKNNSYKKPTGYSKQFDTKVKKDDILMIRSGEGAIGKVALVEEDINAIYSDFIIRIRLSNYNSRFAYYFFRTEIFQKLIEIYKKGLGNNTNIFPNVLKDFPLLNEDEAVQEKIANDIFSKIQENKVNNNKIKKTLVSIEEIIKNTIIL